MLNILQNKKIIVGTTGSIAAYKTPLLVRELIKNGASVKCIMTPSATQFVTPLLLANLTRNKVTIDMFEQDTQSGGAWHIESAHSCDLMIIAPCSATTIARIANGLCDTALSAVSIALPRNIPFLVSPSMDSTMFLHPATQKNIKTLESYGAIIIPPAEGDLSSGLVGPGRFPEINVIMDYIFYSLNISKSEYQNQDNIDIHEGTQNNSKILADKEFNNLLNQALDKNIPSLQDSADKIQWTTELELEKLKKKSQINNIFNGKKILITAGPTIEKIDDVRFISNHSSGKMGYALAEEAKSLGAEVILISGPVTIPSPKGVNLISVQSAEEMYNVAIENFSYCDIAILSAAVADFTPVSVTQGKIKKEDMDDNYAIKLEKTKDILAELGKIKSENQILVGFALESSNEIKNGWKKLKNKNCDLIVVNTAGKELSGFGGDYNTITILTRKAETLTYEAMTKADCSTEIFKTIMKLL